MTYITDAPYSIRLWYPFTVAYEDATYSIELKAPEIGNTEMKARNQSKVRTRAGTTLVYDRGRNYNEKRKFQFRQLKNIEKAQLEVFLEAIQWASSKLKYRDWDDNEYVIRIDSTELEYIDTGFAGRNNPSARFVLWDFDLAFEDITNNIDELEGSTTTVSNALTLHLQDFNHPHNPKVSVTATASIGTVEEFLVDSWDTISWHITIVSGANKACGFVHATNNNVAAGADATSTDVTLEVLNDPAGLFGIVTFTVDLSGATIAQTMRLRAVTSSGSYTVNVRRFKL